MRWLHRTATALGFLVILITVTPVLRWWTAALSSPWGPNTAEYLVIPSGEMFAPDTLGISSYWRSFYGALEWRTGHYGHIVVSGHYAATLMADFLFGHGVPREAILIENEANSTRENAANVAKLLGPNPGRIVLLTSDYHSARALRTFRQAGLNTTALPYPDANKRINVWKDRWTVFLILSDETVKTVWYRVYR